MQEIRKTCFLWFCPTLYVTPIPPTPFLFKDFIGLTQSLLLSAGMATFAEKMELPPPRSD